MKILAHLSPKGTAGAAREPRRPLTRMPASLPGPVASVLRRIIRRDLLVHWGEGLALLAGAGVLVLAAQFLADWWLDFSWPVRFVLLAADLAALGYVGWRYFWLPWRRRLDPRTAALRIEKNDKAWRSAVISAVDLSLAQERGEDIPKGLVQILFQDVKRRIDLVAVPAVIPAKTLRRRGKAAAVAVLLAAAAAFWTWPAAGVLAQRWLLFDVPLPTQTIVVALTGDISAPVGAAVKLAAQAEGVVPRHGRITLHFEDDSSQTHPISSLPTEPGIFRFELPNAQQSFRYQFSLNDGRGKEFHVQVQQPPAVRQLDLTGHFPAYTGLGQKPLVPGNLNLLAGSRLEIVAEATEPLQSAEVVLAGTEQAVPMTVAGRQAKLQLPLEDPAVTGFTVRLIGQGGVASINDTLYPMKVIPDTAPEVRLTNPGEKSLTVTPSARLHLVFAARDDFQLESLALVWKPQQKAEAAGADAESPEQRIPLELKKGERLAQGAYEWDLAKITPPLWEGQALTLWIEARDGNTVTGPGVGASQTVELTVVSEAAKRAELLKRLRDQAAQMQKLKDDQERLRQGVGTLLGPPDAAAPAPSP